MTRMRGEAGEKAFIFKTRQEKMQLLLKILTL
jgi:hypothetical protein